MRTKKEVIEKFIEKILKGEIQLFSGINEYGDRKRKVLPEKNPDGLTLEQLEGWLEVKMKSPEMIKIPVSFREEILSSECSIEMFSENDYIEGIFFELLSTSSHTKDGYFHLVDDYDLERWWNPLDTINSLISTYLLY